MSAGKSAESPELSRKKDSPKMLRHAKSSVLSRQSNQSKEAFKSKKIEEEEDHSSEEDESVRATRRRRTINSLRRGSVPNAAARLVQAPPPPPPKKQRNKNPPFFVRFIQNFASLVWKANTWHLPDVYMPILPLFFCVLVLILLGFFYQTEIPAEDLEGAELSRWMFYCAGSIATLVVTSVVMSILLIMVKIFIGARLFYYLHFVSVPTAVLIWSIVMLASTDRILHDLKPTPSWWLHRIYWSTFLISLTYIPTRILAKYLIQTHHKNQFWNEIDYFMTKERLLYRLAYSQIDLAGNVYSPTCNVSSINATESDSSSLLGSSTSPPPNRSKKSWFQKLTKRDQMTGVMNYLLEQKQFEIDEIQRATHKKTNSKNARSVLTNGEEELLITQSAAALAAIIMDRVDKQNKGYLEVTDFIPFVSIKEREADETIEELADNDFAIFDKNGDGRVTEIEVARIIRTVLVDRKKLRDTLFDRENMGAILNTVLTFLWVCIAVLGVLFIFRIDITEYLLPMGSFLLAVSFIFANSLKLMFEGFLEVFIVRPFDIGDRITMEGYPTLIIHSISLISTECYATDGRLFTIPNNIFFKKGVVSYKRSRDYAVTVSLQIDASTPSQKLSQLRQRLLRWMEEDQSNTGTPWKIIDDDDWMLYVSSVEESSKMTFNIWVELEGVNWASRKRYLVPKSRFFVAIQGIMKELNIGYEEATLPVRILSPIEMTGMGKGKRSLGDGIPVVSEH
eukprot:TRINITY_DN246_c0_g2_i2.p1 TRINITY_DN246_c0_g2~~TRINITY_DN246_c0_g2_i2.p1  ORF type:complete len:736 (-),score=148.96 TRINITY_DN246_c0_g2_i2:231-2438(-)